MMPLVMSPLEMRSPFKSPLDHLAPMLVSLVLVPRACKFIPSPLCLRLSLTRSSYSPPFVRTGRSRSEDPFYTTPGRRTNRPTTPKSAHTVSQDWRSRSSSGSDDGSPLKAKALRISASGAHGQQYGSDAGQSIGGGVVTAQDAQSVYPPSCCVFVANLLQTETEDTLEMAVTQIFREYGPVYVKIRRDAKQMPFAFCQYTRPEHAATAIQEGRGRLIRGRPCRCEKAKAHRKFGIIAASRRPFITPPLTDPCLVRQCFA